MLNKVVLQAIVFRNYRDNFEKACCYGRHKQYKTLFQDNVLRFKIILLDIYNELRLKTLPLSPGWEPSAQSSVWFLFRSCFSALSSKTNNFLIYKKCHFPVNFFVTLIIFVKDCGLNDLGDILLCGFKLCGFRIWPCAQERKYIEISQWTINPF